MPRFKIWRTYGEYVYIEADNVDDAIADAVMDAATNREYDVDPNDVEELED